MQTVGFGLLLETYLSNAPALIEDLDQVDHSLLTQNIAIRGEPMKWLEAENVLKTESGNAKTHLCLWKLPDFLVLVLRLDSPKSWFYQVYIDDLSSLSTFTVCAMTLILNQPWVGDRERLTLEPHMGFFKLLRKPSSPIPST